MMTLLLLEGLFDNHHTFGKPMDGVKRRGESPFLLNIKHAAQVGG